MGKMVLRLLGILLAIWVVFMAVGFFISLVKTFFIIGLIAVVVIMAVSLLTRLSRSR